MTVAGAVLAAGEGRRMGQPKALIPVAGTPLVNRAVEVLRLGGCQPVGVMTGAKGQAVRALVKDRAQVVNNPDWPSGMGSSVSHALRWAEGCEVSALLILPVDTPGIGVPVIARLLDRRRVAFRRGTSPATEIAAWVATYDGAPRNPVVLERAVWADIADCVQADSGARGWLKANPHRVATVECGDIGSPVDLDTPEDLARWVGHLPTATP